MIFLDYYHTLEQYCSVILSANDINAFMLSKTKCYLLQNAVVIEYSLLNGIETLNCLNI